MNIIARGALWGAGIFALTAVVGVLVVTVLSIHFDTGPPTIDGTFWVAAEAGVVAGVLGALVGGLLGMVMRLKGQHTSTMHYDAPQEGVWPPPPIVPGDNEKNA